MIVGVPHEPARGGPGSFQIRLRRELERRGHRFADRRSTVPDVGLVFGGTRRLVWLTGLRARGIPVVHRVGPLNWRYRTERRGWRQSRLDSARNGLVKLIRDRFADHVVYQSEFVRAWWHRTHGPAACAESVIHNGVDLDEYDPRAAERARRAEPRAVCVEASVPGNPVAVAMLRTLSSAFVRPGHLEEIRVYGRAREKTRRALDGLAGVRLQGSVDRGAIPARLAEGDLFVTLEINGACPNAIIEALAAGLPVTGFDTGAARELVGESGRLAPFHGDPWTTEIPDMSPLIEATRSVLERRRDLARHARARAERRFGIERAADAYLAVIREARSAADA